MMNNSLNVYRNNIDEIDQQIANLFERRMQISKQIAIEKKKNNLPIQNQYREFKVIENVKSLVSDDIKEHIEKWYNLLIDLSKKYQETI